MDGDTPATSTTIANADQLILNDNGTMKQIAMTDLADYVASGSDLDILADAKSGGTNFTESLLIGHQTTGTLNAAQYNTGVGRGSLDAITEGDRNTGLGYNSLTANTTGSHNTGLGNAAGDVITTGSNNVVIGSGSDPSAADGSNQTVVGYGVTGQANNSVTLGNADVTAVYLAQDKGATAYGATFEASTGIVPDAADGAYLGTASAEFSDIYLADGAVVNLGDDQDVTLTHVHDTGVLLNSSSQLQFRDSDLKVH